MGKLCWIFRRIQQCILGFNLLTGEAASQSLKETIDKDYCFLQVVTWQRMVNKLNTKFLDFLIHPVSQHNQIHIRLRIPLK